jgi:hypothetical protein
MLDETAEHSPIEMTDGSPRIDGDPCHDVPSFLQVPNLDHTLRRPPGNPSQPRCASHARWLINAGHLLLSTLYSTGATATRAAPAPIAMRRRLADHGEAQLYLGLISAADGRSLRESDNRDVGLTRHAQNTRST